MALFNHFSFRDADVPDISSLLSEIKRFKEWELENYIQEGEWEEDRYVIYLGRFQPRWLKRMVQTIRDEFPGGVPSGYEIYAALLEVRPGAARQNLHADGELEVFWNLFVPLTRHCAQGTTAFEGGIYPSYRCKNYLFDSRIMHYGQANNSAHTRYVLMFMIGLAETFGRGLIPVA